MPVATPPTTPSSPPAAPDRSQPSTFSDRADAWVSWLTTPFWNWLYDLVPWFSGRANEVEAWSNSASESALAAANSASAGIWVSGTSYALGASAIDPTDFFTYRRKIAGAGTIRPGLDATNWQQLGTARTTQLGQRNRIYNGCFRVNQRVYVSGAATAANQYTLDRWKVTSTGGITFSNVANQITVTIPASQTLQQIIEGINLETGTYVLTWTGTAQARVNGGSYSASGMTVSLTGGANTTIEFNTGTVSNVQFEAGAIPTPFERRPIGAELALCQRYFCKTFNQATVPAQNAGASGALEVICSVTGIAQVLRWRFPVVMRSAPAVTTFSPNAASANWSTNTDTPVAIITQIGESGVNIRAETNITATRAYTIHATALSEL